MDSIQKKHKKKKDKKPLYVLAGFLVFFGVFIYLITRPSKQSLAIKEIAACSNKKDVEMVWYKYKADLYQDEDYLLETRKKLSSLNLTEEEIKECRVWLTPAPTSINLIIIPDLSKRIIDSINNPNQISNDIFVLQTIWKSFVNFSKLKQDTKDKLIIDVTDIDQAKGQFGEVANNLQFDLSNHKGKSNRLYFTSEKDKQFEKSVRRMYKLAKDKPLGANYEFYFRRYLINHLKKPTLFDNYINKIIIITDGYLEYENPINNKQIISKTKINNDLRNSVTNGNILEVIKKESLNIPVDKNIDLSNSKILVCEVKERKSGKGVDFDILKTYWTDWFQTMNMDAKNINFIQREQANNITAQKINDFISN